MPQKGKAALLSLPTCPNGQATLAPASSLLPVQAEPLHSPAQMLALIQRFMQEKEIPLQRESYIKLNSMTINSNGPGRKSVPWLSLSGVWLQNAGFKEYEHAKTIALNGMLIVIPGIAPPMVTPNDVRRLNAIVKKINNYVHAQK